MTWIKKKIGPGINNITTTEEAERILTSEGKVVLGYLNSLVVCICSIILNIFGKNVFDLCFLYGIFTNLNCRDS